MKLLVLMISATLLVACGEKPVSKDKAGKTNGPKGAIVESAPVTAKNLEKIQADPVLSWQHADLDRDNFYGVSADKAFSDFNLKQTKEIVVAVIDSGVDHNHPDLKNMMWINKGEIADNGKDDDGNGYIDDIYGWNFIGGADGKNMDGETLEHTRMYKSFLERVNRGEILTETEEALFNEVKELVESSLMVKKKAFRSAQLDKRMLSSYMKVIQVKLGIEQFKSRAEIKSLPEDDDQIKNVKEALLEIWDKYWRGFEGLTRSYNNNKYYVNIGLNIHFDGREKIVGDDPSNFNDTAYGNNDVIGPDASHGTHVAGIIAAERNNNLGMNGVAANVRVMALRAVPNGDERDKDIALAVRYAVDNGAHIINMSFGKRYSPYKAQVDAAFEYAASKGVLMVHAAGNSKKNIDGGKNNFPNSYKLTQVYQVNTIKNWIEVSANTRAKGLDLPASFTNYGKEAATLFAPGHQIFSTMPGMRYAALSGTSMACPVTTGVAALLMSEFPEMKASEAREILMHTVSKPQGLMVRLPQEGVSRPDFRIPVLFSSLSATAGVLNAYNAVELATKMSPNKQ